MSRIGVFDPVADPAISGDRIRKCAPSRPRSTKARRDTSEIGNPFENFGIEIGEFPAEARLSLIIAGFQCDVLYRGQKDALGIPAAGQPQLVVCGNALRLDWLSICPPTGTGVKHDGGSVPYSARSDRN